MDTALLPPEIAAWFASRGWAMRRHQADMLAAAERGDHALLVADPEFYIDFEFDDPPNGVTLVHAPDGCSDSLSKPKPLETDDKKKLDESFFTNIAPGANFGFKMASRVILACP